MSRRRLTWNGRTASAPPAMPGYQEPSIHPAAYPDPEADAYENGDTSSWAEDPHPGPYPNSFHPALPGTDEPMGHPATDPAHYFPPGVTKQASRQLRAAMEAKAAKCIRIAQSMLGRKASVSAIEDQALDLMNLTERQIAAALKRVSSESQAADLLAIENMTLTPERSADESLLAQMMAEEHGAEEHGADEALLAQMMAEEAPVAGKLSEEAEGMLAEMLAEEHGADEAPVAGKLSEQLAEQIAEQIAGKLSGKLSGGKMSEEAKAEAMLAEMLAEVSGKTASRRRASGSYDKMPGDQNDPAHYNFRAEGVLASKKSEEAKADEAKAEEIVEEIAGDVKGAKKAALVQRIARLLAAKKSEETKAEETKAEETKAEEAAAKKAAHYQRLAAHYSRLAKKSEETKAEEQTAEEAAEEPKAGKKAGMTADIKAAIAELLAEESGPMADDLISEEAPMADEALSDDMLSDDLMGDLMADEAPVADDLMALYSMKLAGKKSEEAKAEEAEEADEAVAEEADEQTAEEAKASKKAALRPQARKASNGVKTLGAVAKVASSDVNDLSRLWESAPDVSKVFG